MKESESNVISWRDEFNPPDTLVPNSREIVEPIPADFKGASPEARGSPTRHGTFDEPIRPLTANDFADLETRWPESYGSSAPQMAPVSIEAAGRVQVASAGPTQSNEARHSSTTRNGMSAGQTIALVSGIVLLITGAIGLGRWAWKLLRKRRRDDDDDTDVEEEIDISGDTEGSGSGPTRKLRKRYHARAWHF
jgi:hypothetical protein